MPQPLQFESSLVGSTHEVPHLVCPVAHAAAHRPCEHTCWDPHAVAHLPQFWPSSCRLTHVPLQSVLPSAHAHLPIAHVNPEGQGAPQPPQLAVSVCVSTHVPEQNVIEGSEHVSSQTPLMHWAPCGQNPQLLPSPPASEPLALKPALRCDEQAGARTIGATASRQRAPRSSERAGRWLEVCITPVLTSKPGALQARPMGRRSRRRESLPGAHDHAHRPHGSGGRMAAA
jgi:hypothetical protein